MRSRLISLVILTLLLLLLATACSPALEKPSQPATPDQEGHYRYQVGLGYGFLGRHVQVLVDGREVLSITGDEEIEEFAQLLGTRILAGGSSDERMIQVQVIVDQEAPVEAVIDLEDGGIIHIYYQQTGIEIFNTDVLILE